MASFWSRKYLEQGEISNDRDLRDSEGGACSRGHRGAVMTAIGLGPECEFPRFVFAELGIGEEGLEELDINNNGGSTTLIKGSDETQIAYFPHALGRLQR